jgi:transmembrane sensor
MTGKNRPASFSILYKDLFVALFPPTIETLLMDESFINDCLDKDAAATAYWKAFEQAHPEYAEVLEEARCCVAAMHAWGQSTEIEEQWDKLQEMIGGKGGLRVVGPEMSGRAEKNGGAEKNGEVERSKPGRREGPEMAGALMAGAGQARWISRSGRLAWITGIAATTAGVMVCAGLLVGKGKQQPRPVAYISLSAPAGMVRKCGLPDGSTVWLDAGSTIRYKEDHLGSRDIELVEGQIFCKIKHDEAHPFSVHTPAGLEVKDIGTAFSVQSYKGLNREVVKVTEGEVAVQKADSILELLKKHQGIGWNPEDGKMTRLDNPAVGDTSWISGRIELNDVTFGELAIVLEKTYDLHIAFQHPDLMNCRASTSFNRTDPVRDVLDALKLIYGITYTMGGRSLVLSGGSGHL